MVVNKEGYSGFRSASAAVWDRFKRDESGATIVEYGLLGGFISITILTIMLVIGTHLKTEVYGAVAEALQTVLPGDE